MRFMLNWLFTSIAIAIATFLVPGIQPFGFAEAWVCSVVPNRKNDAKKFIFLFWRMFGDRRIERGSNGCRQYSETGFGTW